MTSLSIVVPCRNGEKSIRLQLDALATQSWDKPWEVIVVDHGSTDGTARVVEEYCSRYSHFRLVRTVGPAGVCHPRNVGIKEACSDKIAFVDADDLVAPGWVAAMGNALAEHEFVAGRKDYAKLNSREVMEALYFVEDRGVDTGYYLPCAPGCNLGVSRAVDKALGGFDTKFRALGDTDYCWRAAYIGVELAYASDALVHYRLRHSPREIYRWCFRQGVAEVQLYCKHRGFGMPKYVNWRSAARLARNLTLGPLRVHDRVSFLSWVDKVARGMGNLYGCAKFGHLPI